MATVKSLALVILFIAFNALVSESRVARMALNAKANANIDRVNVNINANIGLSGSAGPGGILGSSLRSSSGSGSRSDSSDVHSDVGYLVESKARSGSPRTGSYVGWFHVKSGAGSGSSESGSGAGLYARSHTESATKGGNGK